LGQRLIEPVNFNGAEHHAHGRKFSPTGLAIRFCDSHLNSLVLLLAFASLIYPLLNTGLVAGVISLTEDKAFQKEWLHCFYWAFPYFLVGAVAAG
jgi:hypothetical protein